MYFNPYNFAFWAFLDIETASILPAAFLLVNFAFWPYFGEFNAHITYLNYF
jgi:hypothetical protein